MLIHPENITESDFLRIGDFIQSNFGIKMPLAKKVMLESRLRTRLRATGITTFKAYTDYLFSEEGMRNEVVHMIDMVSTNKTDFYREPMHFEYMLTHVLPTLYKEYGTNPIKIWCAAASTGEEPYTIAITLEEFKQRNTGIDYSVYCTDISTQVLEKAHLGIYKPDRIIDIPAPIKTKYFLKSKDSLNVTARVIPEIRKKLTFNRLNLMDDVYKTPGHFDIIFCRNVLIYFERKIQEMVINKLCDKLTENGYLFLGHSESIAGYNVPLKMVKTSMYRKTR